MPTFTQARETEVIESNISSDDQTEQISIQVIQILLTVKDTNFKSNRVSLEKEWYHQLFPIIPNVSTNVQFTLLLSPAVMISNNIKQIRQHGSHKYRNLYQFHMVQDLYKLRNTPVNFAQIIEMCILRQES